jgi:hypothetical protein
MDPIAMKEIAGTSAGREATRRATIRLHSGSRRCDDEDLTTARQSHSKVILDSRTSDLARLNLGEGEAF